MDNALGDAQTIVLFGGTSDIGGRSSPPLSPATSTVVLAGGPTTSTPATCQPARVDVDVVAFDADRTAEHAGLVERPRRPHGDLDVVIVAFGQLGEPPSSPTIRRGGRARRRQLHRAR